MKNLPARNNPSSFQGAASFTSAAWWRCAARTAAREWREHPLECAVWLAACLAVFAGSLLPPLQHSGFLGIYLVFMFAMFSATFVRLLRPMFNKVQEMRDWALEEQESSTIAQLTGSTPEELEKLIAYHMKHGNIEEADSLSQKLIAMIEQEGSTDAAMIAPAAPAQTAAATSQSGLPDWMKNEDETVEVKPATSNLPDWMN